MIIWILVRKELAEGRQYETGKSSRNRMRWKNSCFGGLQLNRKDCRKRFRFGLNIEEIYGMTIGETDGGRPDGNDGEQEDIRRQQAE